SLFHHFTTPPFLFTAPFHHFTRSPSPQALRPAGHTPSINVPSPEHAMKLTRVAVLAFALPIGLAAQQPAAGSQANPITGVFRGRTMNLQRNLAAALDSIPEAKFSYKPTPAQLSIGYIAQHLADDNYFFCNQFGEMKGTRAEKDTATADS